MLYVCPTPIGNLGDITSRVLDALGRADLIAAEDTRRTRKLLSHYNINRPLISFYEHNELRRLPEILSQLEEGSDIALVSDAGMPGISDPGYRLISAALEAGLPVEVLPGPSAVETALVSSGFPTDAFIFLGYLPRKKGELERVLGEIVCAERTCVAFEAPHRLRATLAAAAPLLGERNIAICRELTKRFGEVKRGNAAGLLADLPEKPKGEIVLVFEPARERERVAGEPGKGITEEVRTALSAMLAAGIPARKAAELVSSLTGTPKNKVYKSALALKEKTTPPSAPR